MNRLVIYIHGKGGNAKEAEHDFRENYHYICKRNRSIPYGYAEGEHWFHTEKQMEFLDKWITDCDMGEKMDFL